MVDLQDAAARMYAAKKFRNASKGITAGAADFDLKEDMFDDKLEDDKLKLVRLLYKIDEHYDIEKLNMENGSLLREKQQLHKKYFY